MDNYGRMVIDLYKEVFTDYKQHQVNCDRILEVQKHLATAITSAKVLGSTTDELDKLIADVDYLKYELL